MVVRILIAILQVLLLWFLEHKFQIFYNNHNEKTKDEVYIL